MALRTDRPGFAVWLLTCSQQLLGIVGSTVLAEFTEQLRWNQAYCQLAEGC